MKQSYCKLQIQIALMTRIKDYFSSEGYYTLFNCNLKFAIVQFNENILLFPLYRVPSPCPGYLCHRSLCDHHKNVFQRGFFVGEGMHGARPTAANFSSKAATCWSSAANSTVAV